MKSITLIAPINGLSYGIIGINVLNELHKRGVRVSLFPIGPIEVHPKFHTALKECVDNAKFPDWDAPCLRIFHQFDMSQFVGRGKKVGWPIFELNKFNEQEIHHLQYLDSIITCSNWGRKVLTDNLQPVEDIQEFSRDIKTYIKVVPLGVDTKIFFPKESFRPQTIFCNIGKTEVRKGHDVLVKAFNEAFEEDDDVELWIMWDNPFLDKQQKQEWQDLYCNSKLSSKINFINRVQTQEQVANIIQQTDCGVFLSRAEGWNLPLLEFMSCGKHVITTNYSAHTEFCNEKNSHLIKVTDLETAYDGIWFHGQGEWAKFDNNCMRQTVEYMREIHQLKQSGQLITNDEGIKTAQRFTWTNTVSKLLEVMENYT